MEITDELKNKILLDVEKNGESSTFKYGGIDKNTILINDYNGLQLLNVIYIPEHISDYTLNLKTRKPTKNSKGQGILSDDIISEILSYSNNDLVF